MTARHSQAPTDFRQVAPDRLQIREGGGCVSLFGLPFFAAGVFVTLIGLRVVPVTNPGEVPGWAWPLLIAMGLVFVAAGGALVFGRRWVEIDRGRGRLREQRGLLVPMDRRERGLHEFDRVVLRFEAGDSDTADRYPVALRARAGGDEFAVHSTTEFATAFAAAAQLAGFLQLPLEDRTTGAPVVREPGEVGRTLQARLRSGEERLDHPIRPPSPRSQVREGAGSALITIPAAPVHPIALLPSLIPAGLVAWFGRDALQFFEQTRTPPGVQYAIAAFVGLFFVVVPLLGVLSRLRHAARGGTVVRVSGDELAIEERGAWRSRTTTIAVADLLDVVPATAGRARAELEAVAVQRVAQPGRGAAGRRGPRWAGWLRSLVKSDGVRVKARGGLYGFGAGLADAEVEYLAAVVRRAFK